MKRYLIINADDYGMCHATNAAVEDLFKNGYITSTTLMTPCPWAEDGLRRAKNNPCMNVGLHLTLNSEWDYYRWGPVARTPVPSLLDEGGYFYKKVAPLLQRAIVTDVTSEFDAQLKWMTSRGVHPTHIDNHMGSACGLEGQSFLREIFAMCVQNKLPFRLPRNAKGVSVISPELEVQLAEMITIADNLKIGILDYLWYFDRPLNQSDSYETVKVDYLNIIRNIGYGINELYVHPAFESNELKAIYPGWQLRVWEHSLMRDDDLYKVINEEGIILTSWKIFSDSN